MQYLIKITDITHEVVIEPRDVIKKLIENEIGWRSWMLEKDSKYFICTEESAGCHSFKIEKETTKEIYDYVISLQLVLNRLNVILV